MSLRASQIVLREGAGAFVNGIYTAGTRTTTTTIASVQPVKMGQDMDAVPEGRRLSDFKKVYTADRLQMTGPNAQPDIIVHGGFGYELVDMDENQSGVISHYRYLVRKVFAFTSLQGWTSGTLKRP